MGKTVRGITTSIFLGLLLIIILSSTCYAQNYEKTYFLLKDQSTYELNLSITHQLLEYYHQKNHHLTLNNFASFVTPYSLALVARDINSIFPHEEDFVNGVLMLVHQIPYKIMHEAKYPVETIVENEGDCDLLSFFASSLIKAQGLNVVLFYYEDESHMNIGVNLSQPPRDARSSTSYVDYQGTRYYMAECTGENWQNGWRVGECPPELEGANVNVVTLENCEQIAPGQVSSSFGSLESSAMSLTAPSSFVMEESTIMLSGQVSVSDPDGTVIIYVTKENSNWESIGTADLNSNGRYTFLWRPIVWGYYNVKASWSGNDEYAGADSNVASVFVIPKFLLLLGGGIIIMILLMVVILLMRGTTQAQEEMALQTYYTE